MIFNIEKLLSSEDMISQYDERDIYSYYLGDKIDSLRKLYLCPLHEEKTPSLSFYQSNKYLNFKCFGCGKSGNIFEMVKSKYNLSYGEAVDKIRRDFFTRTSKVEKNISKNTFKYFEKEIRKTEIYPKFRNWNKIDYDYWNSYHIPLSLLQEYKINPCSSVYYRNKIGEYRLFATHSNNNPIYHYNVNYSDKIYRPLHTSKRGKWFQNCTAWDVQGLENIPRRGNRLFITSSLKDVLSLRMIGEWAVAPQGEGVLLPDKIIDYLFATWKEIIIFYDYDVAGLRAAYKHSKYYSDNMKYIFTKDSKYKDPSDYLQKYGIDNTREMVKDLLI